jgi:hypothetical protein
MEQYPSFPQAQPNAAMPPPQQRPGLFSKPAPPPSMSPEIAESLTETIRRLRVLEERYTTMHRKVQVNEQNSLLKHKKMESDIKRLALELREAREELATLRDSMRTFVKELQGGAKREEVEVLKRYINLWEPLNFVSRNELSKILDELLEQKFAARTTYSRPNREQNL